MRLFVLYGAALFVGVPLLAMQAQISSMPDETRQDLAKAARELNGRLYNVRIDCGRGREPRIIRVHGRDEADAVQTIKRQVARCSVRAVGEPSDPIWQEAIKGAR